MPINDHHEDRNRNPRKNQIVKIQDNDNALILFLRIFAHNHCQSLITKVAKSVIINEYYLQSPVVAGAGGSGNNSCVTSVISLHRLQAEVS